MAKLISLYRDDGQNPLGKRELPLPFDENIAVNNQLQVFLSYNNIDYLAISDGNEITRTKSK